MLSTLQSEDEEVESALIPFLQAYVSKLRNSQKRGGSVSQVPESTALHTCSSVPALPALTTPLPTSCPPHRPSLSSAPAQSHLPAYTCATRSGW